MKEFYKKGVSYKGLTGGWSKYGGPRKSIMQLEVEAIWSCQSCGKQQPKELSPFKFEYPENEYIRVCALCLADNCSKLFKRLGLQR